MSNHSKKHPGLEIDEAGDIAATKDKSLGKASEGKVAQVSVFPHDEWEDLDLERGVAKPVPPVKPTDAEVARHRKHMLIAALVGCLIIALALGLGLGLGLNKTSRRVRHHHVQGPIPALKGAVGPKAPAAGSTASKVVVSDAAQLKSLLAFKAAVDGTNILKTQWVPSGSNFKYCGWKYVVCDTTGRVVEGINMTTDVYEVVFNGTLPPASALKGLPGLREIDIRLHMISGELPADWSQLKQLELIRLDQNNIGGTLPPSWGELRRLRTLTLWDNKIGGDIPLSWADMQSLEILDLSYNKLTGPLPDAFAAMGSLRELLLDVNQFEGDLPDAWGSLPNLQKIFLSENKLTGPLPESWGELQGLTDLWVEYNQLDDTLPSSYGNLKHVQHLSLNDNTFSGSIPSSWAGMAALEKLYLYNNPQLGGCVPAGLKDQLQGSLGFTLDYYVEEGTKVRGYCKA